MLDNLTSHLDITFFRPLISSYRFCCIVCWIKHKKTTSIINYKKWKSCLIFMIILLIQKTSDSIADFNTVPRCCLIIMFVIIVDFVFWFSPLATSSHFSTQEVSVNPGETHPGRVFLINFCTNRTTAYWRNNPLHRRFTAVRSTPIKQFHIFIFFHDRNVENSFKLLKHVTYWILVKSIRHLKLSS